MDSALAIYDTGIVLCCLFAGVGQGLRRHLPTKPGLFKALRRNAYNVTKPSLFYPIRIGHIIWWKADNLIRNQAGRRTSARGATKTATAWQQARSDGEEDSGAWQQTKADFGDVRRRQLRLGGAWRNRGWEQTARTRGSGRLVQHMRNANNQERGCR
jgi:hypothetical protein